MSEPMDLIYKDPKYPSSKVVNGLSMAGAPVGIQRIVIGIIVVGAVLMDIVFRRGIGGRKAAPKKNAAP